MPIFVVNSTTISVEKQSDGERSETENTTRIFSSAIFREDIETLVESSKDKLEDDKKQ